MDDSLDLIILMILVSIITFVLGWCIGDSIRSCLDADLYRVCDTKHCKTVFVEKHNTQQTVQSYIKCRESGTLEKALKESSIK